MNDDIFIKLEKINSDFNSKFSKFVIEASMLVELSEDAYQIEKTLEMNKISLKGFILESNCCSILKDKGYKDYSIEELKTYLVQYENTFNEDCSKYHLALSLYMLSDELEQLYDIKIDTEITILKNIITDISQFKNFDSVTYDYLQSKLKDYCLDNSLLESQYTAYTQCLSDIVNYSLNGYPTISDEYLYMDS